MILFTIRFTGREQGRLTGFHDFTSHGKAHSDVGWRPRVQRRRVSRVRQSAMRKADSVITLWGDQLSISMAEGRLLPILFFVAGPVQ